MNLLTLLLSSALGLRLRAGGRNFLLANLAREIGVDRMKTEDCSLPFTV